MDRIDFMNCPFCSGHEAMTVPAVERLRDLIEEHVGVDEDVQPELQNIVNVIRNSAEPGRPAPAVEEDLSWMDE